MNMPPPLSEQLEAITEQIGALEAEARTLLENHPPEPVNLRRLDHYGRNVRYVVVRPDGEPYHDVPGMRWTITTFKQRPAALRAAKGLPGVRIWDMRENVFIPMGG